MIPYVISEAHPDYKRPWLHEDFGVVKEEELETYFLDKICYFILDSVSIETLKCQDDIARFFDCYYDEYFMSNSPWRAVVFRNGKWENMTPSSDKIWEHIQLIKLQEEGDKEEEEEEDENEEEFNLTEDDKEILTKLKVCFEQSLSELSLETIDTLKHMDPYQQFMFLFNNVTPKKYSENKELFHKFLDVCIKLMQKDVRDITQKLEIDHDEKLSEQLHQLMAVYSNAVLVKQTFNI